VGIHVYIKHNMEKTLSSKGKTRYRKISEDYEITEELSIKDLEVT